MDAKGRPRARYRRLAHGERHTLHGDATPTLRRFAFPSPFLKDSNALSPLRVRSGLVEMQRLSLLRRAGTKIVQFERLWGALLRCARFDTANQALEAALKGLQM